MSTTDGNTGRPLRADAQRNRARIIAAANEIFAQHGLDASVARIAARAEVGTGTLFRNFKTKDDLILAVVETRVGEVVEMAQRALAMDDPGAAFDQFHVELARMKLRDVGFFHALRQREFDHPAIRERKQEILALMRQILRRAQRAKAVRADVTIDDVRFMMLSLAQADLPVGELAPGSPMRHLRILLDGFKPECASKLPRG